MKNFNLRYEETGEVRPPRAGEFFRGNRGVDQARFDFHVQEFPILREVLEEAPVSHQEDKGNE